MSQSKTKLVALGLVAAALAATAVVLLEVLQTDPMELVDGLDTNALEWGDEEVTLFDPAPGRYFVVVDGAAGQLGGYRLGVSCP